MDYVINIVYCNPDGGIPKTVHEIPLCSEHEVYEQGQAISWAYRSGGNYIIECCIDDEVIKELVTDGAGAIAIVEQLTLRGIAA